MNIERNDYLNRLLSYRWDGQIKVISGTWAGATENIRHNYSHTFCWNNNSYKGNMELIKLGAIPIDDDFNPNDAKKPLKTEHHSENLQQMSFFDINRKPE